MSNICQEYSEFIDEIKHLDGRESLKDFLRRKIIHGTPYVFNGKEDDYYFFLKKIADQYSVPFNSIHISGSGKLGFSILKGKKFDLDSDIDVAIISRNLFDHIMDMIGDFQILLRQQSVFLTEQQRRYYFKFLRYTAMGWIRPDLLPLKSSPSVFKNRWFDFFKSISHENCLAGNYKVSAGVFKSYKCFEKYTLVGLKNFLVEPEE